MEKEELFSKLNIKNYNNDLEEIIENKSFSVDTKNLLLSIFYKIEVAYEDYTKVKVLSKPRREILEELLQIIKNDCEEIEIVRPKINEKTVLKNKNYKTSRKNKKIISYPNEASILSALYAIKGIGFKVNKEYPIIENSLSEILNLGYNINSSEIIKDFDGWSWNRDITEVEDMVSNIIYQNLQMLVGQQFLENWKNDEENDYIELLKERLNGLFTKKVANRIFTTLCQICILKKSKKSKLETARLRNLYEIYKEEYAIIQDKKKYLNDIATERKKLEANIKKIDEKLNNVELMKKSFIEENKKLKDNEKIFSLSEYSEKLQSERNQNLLEIKAYTKSMNPKNYMATKKELEENIEILSILDENYTLEEIIIKMQKVVLKAIEEKIFRVETKKQIIELIYIFRYYERFLVARNKEIKDLSQIKKDLNQAKKRLILTACNFKVLNILSLDVETNNILITKALDTRLIDLGDIIIEFSKKGEEDKITFNVYEDKVIRRFIKLENSTNINTKLNKKIKLFN